MRLLNVHTLKFQNFNNYTPRYAVASHRWTDDEIHYEDVTSSQDLSDRIGGKKLEGFCNAVKSLKVDGLDWLWMDTTCIKQDSDREVNEAVNSMFRWYEHAYICLAYLQDRPHDDLKRSVWFTRGWTLQELIAPRIVAFYDKDWNLAGHKGAIPDGLDLGRSLTSLISEATCIPREVLLSSDAMSGLSAQEKWNWMDYRVTTKQEDRAYCMLGIFGVTLSPIYGEGGPRAIDRLRNELLNATRQEFVDGRLSLRINPSRCWKLLYIKTSNPANKFVVIVHQTDSIWEVKGKIQELEGYFAQRHQQLRLRDHDRLGLGDTQKLSRIGIEDGDTLSLSMKLSEHTATTALDVPMSELSLVCRDVEFSRDSSVNQYSDSNRNSSFNQDLQGTATLLPQTYAAKNSVEDSVSRPDRNVESSEDSKVNQDSDSNRNSSFNQYLQGTATIPLRGHAATHSVEGFGPLWDVDGWLDETMSVNCWAPPRFCDMTLDQVLVTKIDLKFETYWCSVLHKRSRPFAQWPHDEFGYFAAIDPLGKFVLEISPHGKGDLPENVWKPIIQSLGKAFAVEFNGLLKIDPPLDFDATLIVMPDLDAQGQYVYGGCASQSGMLGNGSAHTKYNSNSGWVSDDSSDYNKIAQAFSHFTFERSEGKFLIADLEGFGLSLCDASIQTKDENPSDLSQSNIGLVGIKLFFIHHVCNTYCDRLGLQSNFAMLRDRPEGEWTFRVTWKAIEEMACCSNKWCRKIVRVTQCKAWRKYPGHQWCDRCWYQLKATSASAICRATSTDHAFEYSRFFYASQGHAVPDSCPAHSLDTITPNTIREKSIRDENAPGASSESTRHIRGKAMDDRVDSGVDRDQMSTREDAMVREKEQESLRDSTSTRPKFELHCVPIPSSRPDRSALDQSLSTSRPQPRGPRFRNLLPRLQKSPRHFLAL